MSEYEFRRIEPSNYNEFISLFEAVHGLRLNSEVVSRKFDTAYTGADHIGFFAFSKEGECAAYYGIFLLS